MSDRDSLTSNEQVAANNPHAKWLRELASHMRAEHNWSHANTCEGAAREIEALARHRDNLHLELVERADRAAVEPPAGLHEANERLATMMVGAAGKHAERVVELEAEVSTLRESLAEVNRLLSLNVREVERLQAQLADGPDEEDGPWAEGWAQRTGHEPVASSSKGHCAECGMLVDIAAEYHPYAACLMFKGCHDGEIVRANLLSVQASGAQAEADLRAVDGFTDALAQALYGHDPGAVKCAMKHADDIVGDSMDALALRRLAEEVRRLRVAPPPPAAIWKCQCGHTNDGRARCYHCHMPRTGEPPAAVRLECALEGIVKLDIGRHSLTIAQDVARCALAAHRAALTKPAVCQHDTPLDEDVRCGPCTAPETSAPLGFGIPVLRDLALECMRNGLSQDDAIAAVARDAELRSEAIAALRAALSEEASP